MDRRALAMGSTCRQGTGVRAAGHENPSAYIPPRLGTSIHHPLSPSINPLPAWTPLRHSSGQSIQFFWDLGGCGVRQSGMGINPAWGISHQMGWPGNSNLARDPIPTQPGNQFQLGLGINAIHLKDPPQISRISFTLPRRKPGGNILPLSIPGIEGASHLPARGKQSLWEDALVGSVANGKSCLTWIR